MGRLPYLVTSQAFSKVALDQAATFQRSAYTSNNPCGEKSTLLAVRAINTMNPAPEVHYARAYADPHYADPRYAPRYADPNAYGDPNGYGQDSPADPINGDYNGDYAGNSYVVVPGYAFLPHRRPEHPHRPDSHHNSNSGPVRKN